MPHTLRLAPLDLPGLTRFAQALAPVLHPGDTLLLQGELGAGKTAFVRLLAAALDVPADEVSSPSFALVNEYQGRLLVYHMDLYRLSGAEEAEASGLLEYFDGSGIVAVEWPERLGALAPESSLTLTFVQNPPGQLALSLSLRGASWQARLSSLQRLVAQAMPNSRPPETLISFQSCPKGYTRDQDKVFAPQETLARFRTRLSACGLDILQEIRRVDKGRLDIPVYFSVCGAEARRVIGNKKQMGKGASPEQSQASACMELAERFSFFSFLENPANFLKGDYADMTAQGFPVLPLETLLDSVHDQRHSPELLGRMLAGLPLNWVWARRVSDDSAWLVPLSWFYAINEFNGPAAGNTLEEAALQALCELVERHVCARICQERLAVPELDPESVASPVARELLDKFHRNGIRLKLYDFSLDTGIPTVGVLAWDPTTFPEKSEIVFTAGTTPGVDKAVIRALTEVAQLAGDFNSGSNYVASGLPKPHSLDELAFLHSGKTVTAAEIADLHRPDFLDELRACAASLVRLGLEVYVVNATHPGLQVPVVYAIMPGAHFRERAAGGNALLFAAKLAKNLLSGQSLTDKLAAMQDLAPDEYALPFYQGQQLFEAGDPEAALALLRQALALSPVEEDRPYLYSYLGCCLRDLGRFAEAIAELERGLACDEERPDMHNAMGVCLYKLNRFAEAARHFGRAVALNPASAIDYANLALNLEKTGQLAEARRNYETALSLDASITFAREHLAALNQTETP